MCKDWIKFIRNFILFHKRTQYSLRANQLFLSNKVVKSRRSNLKSFNLLLLSSLSASFIRNYHIPLAARGVMEVPSLSCLNRFGDFVTTTPFDSLFFLFGVSLTSLVFPSPSDSDAFLRLNVLSVKSLS